MSLLPALSDVPASHFQAAWYYSLVLAGLVFFIGLGGVWGMTGAMRIWRSGDHAAGAIIAAATLTAVLTFAGVLLAGIVGLIATGGNGCCGS